MKITKNYTMKMNAAEAVYALLGGLSVIDNTINPPNTRKVGEILAYLYGQNKVLRAKLNEKGGVKENVSKN